MQPALADQLKNIKQSQDSEFGRLPIREEVLSIVPNNKEGINSFRKLWDKLNNIRKNLKQIKRYLDTNKGESLIEWLKANNQGMSNLVVDKIGNFNNDTGGITAYYLDLAKYYNDEEEKYDKEESESDIPADIKVLIEEMRTEREGKRKTRREFGKVAMRDLKKSGKGFFKMPEGEENEMPVQEAAAADGEDKKEEKKEQEKPSELIKKAKNNYGVWICGALITVTIIGAAYYALKEE